LVLDHEYIMVDCGDGSCRQYLKSNLKWNKPLTILFTHPHSDHTMGILGFLQSADLMGRTAPITIYGYRGIVRFITNLYRGHGVKFGYDFKVIEIETGDSITTDSFIVDTCETKHSIKPSLAYKITLPDKEGELDIAKCIKLGIPKNSPLLGKLKRGENVVVKSEIGMYSVTSEEVVGKPQKGRVIAFSGDTRPTARLEEFFKDVDYLTYETTFRSDELDLAKKVKHSTAEEAGRLAEKAGVKHLLCNHFSARHANTDGFYKDIREFYSGRVIVTKDFMEIQIE